MRVEKIYCDCCGNEIEKPKYGEAEVFSITLTLSPFDSHPGQLFGCQQDICYQCGIALRDFYTARQKEFAQKKVEV